MQIIIPMSGLGERFKRAGYTVPKPLIEVDGKTIIEHVIDLFPGEKDITFICNKEHLIRPEFRMEEILMLAAPTARICAIEGKKLGPIDAVLRGAPDLDPDRPTFVNYCDFTCVWDWNDFKAFVVEADCDGAIPSYRDFHPHSLGSTLYAYVRETGRWAYDIQEKKPFTHDPKNEFASSGGYYFRSGRMMVEAFNETIDRDLSVNGEFYVSMAYKPLFDRRARVGVYEIPHFMQWGTPEDLEEYVGWSNLFRALAAGGAAPPTLPGSLLMPAAGLGSRFAKEGFTAPKPLIPVSGEPMIMRAIDDLPHMEKTTVILRRDMPGLRETIAALDAADIAYPVLLDHVTDGQARTCLIALQSLDEAQPLAIGACDNGLLYDAGRLAGLTEEADVIAFGKRGHPAAKKKPEHFGWIDADARGFVASVSVKKSLRDPASDPIVTGAFWFKSGADFRRAAERMIERKGVVNGEYYVDECINDAIALGLSVRLFEVDHYLGWGTPDELRTFDYWTRCFDKWPSHPYSMSRDRRIPQSQVQHLRAQAPEVRPPRPVR